LDEGKMTEYLIRFVVGGAVVSAFAVLGDVLRLKSLAGLFGAAPSVAMAPPSAVSSSHCRRSSAPALP
jgi:hypothetical protein